MTTYRLILSNKVKDTRVYTIEAMLIIAKASVARSAKEGPNIDTLVLERVQHMAKVPISDTQTQSKGWFD
jgi:hypothetical protein